jgi:hypothetical protein
MIAAMVRREILGMVVPPDALKIVLDFQYVRLQRNEKIHTVNATESAQLCPDGSESSIELPLPDNRP